ncbi:MAG: phage terminase large subunit, partial [Bacteroidota bacterium]
MEEIVKYNEVYADVFDADTRYNVLYGGGGSGKSEFIAQRLLNQCLTNKGYQYAIIRKNASTLRNSVYQLCKNIVGRWNYNRYFKFYDGRLEIQCNGNR